MSALDELVNEHPEYCDSIMSADCGAVCDCGRSEAAAELAALRAELAAAGYRPFRGYQPPDEGNYAVLCREGEGKAEYTFEDGWGDFRYEVIAWKPLEEK